MVSAGSFARSDLIKRVRAKSVGIQFFKLAVTLIALQPGDQFRNQSENVERHRRMMEASAKISFFDVDAFS